MPVVEGSIAIGIGGLGAGDEAAVAAFLARFRAPLEAYARRKLRRLGASRAVADEQDLAQEAMATVIDGIRKRKYEGLEDRDALIKLLLSVTWRGALRLKRYQVAARRTERTGGPPEVPEPDDSPDREPGSAGGVRWECRAREVIAIVAGRERAPEEVVAIREEVRSALGILPDDRDRHLLLLKLEGYTHEEIAERLDCSKRTISLRYQRIRRILRERAR